MTMSRQRMPDGEVEQRDVIYYLAVAGDVAATWRQWKRGFADNGSASVTYSGQFFDTCETTGCRGIVSYPSDKPTMVGDSRVVVRSRKSAGQHSGVVFHLQRLWTSLKILADLLRERPRYAVLMDGVCYWFVLAPVRLLGIRIILSVHTVFWPPFSTTSRVRRAMLALEGRFIRRHSYATMGVSRQIVDQAAELAGSAIRSTVFMPYYDRRSFDRIRLADAPSGSVRLLYIGRVESFKGVFDLLQVVSTLKTVLPGPVFLTIVGDGSAFASLQDEIIRLNLGDAVSARGACSRDQVIAELEEAQIVVVPTRTTFPEGYAKSAVESILARRPLVTSAVCPALHDLQAAVEEATPDDVGSYTDAILKLCRDPDLYAERVRAAGIIREMYFDKSMSWGAKLQDLIES